MAHVPVWGNINPGCVQRRKELERENSVVCGEPDLIEDARNRMTSFRVLLTVLFLISVTQVHCVQHPGEIIRKSLYRFFKPSLPKVRGPDPGRGSIKNCAPDKVNFTVEWEPKIIDPEGNITVYYDYTIPHDFKSGTAQVALYFNNIPNPIFQDDFPVNCDKIQKYIPCPLKGGIRLHGKYPYSNLLILKGYDGTYEGHVQLKNADGQIMFCANATVTIQGRG